MAYDFVPEIADLTEAQAWEDNRITDAQYPALFTITRETTTLTEDDGIEIVISEILDETASMLPNNTITLEVRMDVESFAGATYVEQVAAYKAYIEGLFPKRGKFSFSAGFELERMED